MWGKLHCPLEIDSRPSKRGVFKITDHDKIWSQPRASNNPILLMSSNYLHNSCMFINVNLDTDIHLSGKWGQRGQKLCFTDHTAVHSLWSGTAVFASPKYASPLSIRCFKHLSLS